MTDVRSDREVVSESLRNPHAFGAIVDRHHASVHRYLHRRAGRDLADELAAQTFAVGFERRATCRTSGDSALPWLYGIATRLLRRSRRTEVRRLRAYARSGVDRFVELEEDALARLDAASHGPELAAALASMRPPERDALLLYALGDLAYAEIAVALDVSVGTVRTWLHRARLHARRQLETARPVPFTTTSGVDLDGRAGSLS